MKKYRINVTNWQGDDSVLQITSGDIVLQSSGAIEDTFATEAEVLMAIESIPKNDTYTLAVSVA